MAASFGGGDTSASRGEVICTEVYRTLWAGTRVEPVSDEISTGRCRRETDDRRTTKTKLCDWPSVALRALEPHPGGR